jgi:hypothetical protein
MRNKTRPSELSRKGVATIREAIRVSTRTPTGALFIAGSDCADD